jgi:hypothetical protein
MCEERPADPAGRRRGPSECRGRFSYRHDRSASAFLTETGPDDSGAQYTFATRPVKAMPDNSPKFRASCRRVATITRSRKPSFRPARPRSQSPLPGSACDFRSIHCSLIDLILTFPICRSQHPSLVHSPFLPRRRRVKSGAHVGPTRKSHRKLAFNHIALRNLEFRLGA